MKRFNTIIVLLLIIMTGCNGNRKSNCKNDDLSTIAIADTFITVDVSKKYPLKELILQDIMDVEYIVLESTNEFLCQGVVQAIGKEIIVIRNNVDDGDIFIFDRKGKGLRKFNRKGQGPEEYILYLSVFLDEYNDEIYVDEVIRNILVYDLHGNFLRSIPRSETRWINANNYDSDYLIARESPSTHTGKETNNQRFVIISKKDGSTVRDFRIYFDKRVEWGITNRARNAGGAPRLFPIISYDNSWLLMEPSSDTIFRISSDYSLIPFMSRTPSIESMTPAIFLLPCIFTERYYFMETIKMEADFSRQEGFPKTRLAYDIIENTLFEYTVFNEDFLKKVPVDFAMQETTNSEIAFCKKLESHELIEAYEKGQLKGKLKEIASKLEQESNPVIMLVKYKKHGQ
jgi:hypothetical protein